MLDEDSYALAEQQDVVRKRFVRAWDGLADNLKVRNIYDPATTWADNSVGVTDRGQLPPIFRFNSRHDSSTVGASDIEYEIH